MVQDSITHNNNLQTQCLDLLRFPLAIVVLFVHIFGNTLSVSPDKIVEGSSLLYTFGDMVDAFLGGRSVPIYFFISGYFFFRTAGFSWNQYIQKLKNRIHTLFIPYIVWNIVALLVIFFFRLAIFASVNPIEDTPDFSLSALLNTFWNKNCGVFPIAEPSGCVYPQNDAMWFIRDLMVISLFTPLIYVALRRGGMGILLLLATMWALIECNIVEVLWFPIQGLFFFSSGAYMSIKRCDIVESFDKVKYSSAIVCVVTSVMYMMWRDCLPLIASLMHMCSIFTGLITAINIAAYLISQYHCRVSGFLRSSAIFIYMAQTMCAKYLFKAIEWVVQPFTGFQYILLSVVALIISLGFLLMLYYVMRRYTPSLLFVMTGRKPQ